LNERAAFREMLQIEFRGRELFHHEKRRAAERMWHKFLKYGWRLQSLKNRAHDVSVERKPRRIRTMPAGMQEISLRRCPT
jgi:hypothetical protein